MASDSSNNLCREKTSQSVIFSLAQPLNTFTETTQIFLETDHMVSLVDSWVPLCQVSCVGCTVTPADFKFGWSWDSAQLTNRDVTEGGFGRFSAASHHGKYHKVGSKNGTLSGAHQNDDDWHHPCCCLMARQINPDLQGTSPPRSPVILKKHGAPLPLALDIPQDFPPPAGSTNGSVSLAPPSASLEAFLSPTSGCPQLIQIRKESN